MSAGGAGKGFATIVKGTALISLLSAFAFVFISLALTIIVTVTVVVAVATMTNSPLLSITPTRDPPGIILSRLSALPFPISHLLGRSNLVPSRLILARMLNRLRLPHAESSTPPLANRSPRSSRVPLPMSMSPSTLPVWPLTMSGDTTLPVSSEARFSSKSPS